MEREAERQGCGIRRNSNGCRRLDLLCQPGDYQITASAADTYTGRVFSQTRQIRVVNQRPNAPEGTAAVTAQRSNGKVLVEFAATAADPDGDEVTLEWMGRGDDYFGAFVKQK